MSKEYGYIGKEVTQSFRDNKGIFTPQDIIELDQENKWTNFGQLELISTLVSSGSTTTMEFTELKESEYGTHVFVFSNMQSGTSGSGGQVSYRVFTSQYGYDTNSHYATGLQRCNSNGTFDEFKQNNTSFPYIQGHPLSSNANQAMNAIWYFHGFGDSTQKVFSSGHTTSQHANGQFVSNFGNVVYIKERPVTQIRFMIGSGSTAFTDGCIISLYGIRSF